MYEVGEKKSLAKKPQNCHTRPAMSGMKSPFGRLFSAKCKFTSWPILPPMPVSPGTKAFIVVPEPSTSENRLIQLVVHADVPFLTCVDALAVHALAARPTVTATAEAAKNARVKRLRIKVHPSFWSAAWHPVGLGGQDRSGLRQVLGLASVALSNP